ncbi:MAG: hypothetical protein QNK35_02420, partial [Bacteroides sp.]|nr:hypothetical protein [Bacteroides sp.]
MRNIIGISGAVFIISLFVVQACNPPWEDHYSNQEDYIDMDLWDAVSIEPRFSTFVSEVQALGLDSIFKEGQVYTLYIPDNTAFESISDTGDFMQVVLPYHITQTIFINRNVQDWRKLLTISNKFALIEAVEGGYTFEGIPVEFSSPLFRDGRYYEISSVALPKPNLYEYTAQISSVLKAYIDSKDSVYLDRSKSTPIGFDDEGNTIYDSIFGVVNNFEEEFFPVNEEFRDKAATFIIFTQEQYEMALDDMAGRLGGVFVDHNDIPFVWQDQVLLPNMTAKAMFDGYLSYEDLQQGRIQSITGDTVEVEAENIDPESRSLCSNGLAYLYSQFYIEDDLFKGNTVQEGELLIDSVGAGKFAWKEGVSTGGVIIAPEKAYATVASEGALVNVPFTRNFEGEYSLEFTFTNLFPMRYRLEWRANSRPSGVFAVF